MSKSDFIFSDLSSSDVFNLLEDAYVFNLTREMVNDVDIVLTSFDDDVLGSSRERGDIFILNDSGWEWLDLCDVIENAVSNHGSVKVGTLLHGYDYSKVLLVVRRMSNMLLDRNSYSQNVSVFSIVDSEYNGLFTNDELNSPSYIGILAKNRIYLNGSLSDIEATIKDKVPERGVELIEWLRKGVK